MIVTHNHSAQERLLGCDVERDWDWTEVPCYDLGVWALDSVTWGFGILSL